MVTLGRVCEQIEERVVVGKEVLGVSCLGADNVWSLNGIATEEDRLPSLAGEPSKPESTHEVEADNVVVSLTSVQLDGKATRVTGLIWVLAADGYSGEADKGWCLLADGGQEVGFLRKCQCVSGNCTLATYGKALNVLGGLKVPKSARSARMDHALEVLGTVEGLLLLEQPDIAGNWDAANVLAVRTTSCQTSFIAPQTSTYGSGNGMPSLLVK
jgi:hypothetical protein